jgi:hypothetical protein
MSNHLASLDARLKTIYDLTGVNQDFYDGGVRHARALPLLPEFDPRFPLSIPNLWRENVASAAKRGGFATDGPESRFRDKLLN